MAAGAAALPGHVDRVAYGVLRKLVKAGPLNGLVPTTIHCAVMAVGAAATKGSHIAVKAAGAAAIFWLSAAVKAAGAAATWLAFPGSFMAGAAATFGRQSCPMAAEVSATS